MKPIIASFIIASLCGCAAPGKSKMARLVYRLTPVTVSVGAFIPDNDPIRRDRVLLSVSGTWQIKPFSPPVPLPPL